MESGDGTGSILDIQGIASDPHFFHASPLSPADLTSVFGSVSPTRGDVEILLTDGALADEFWESIGRGEARYVIVYANHAPAQIFFAGMSFD